MVRRKAERHVTAHEQPVTAALRLVEVWQDAPEPSDPGLSSACRDRAELLDKD